MKLKRILSVFTLCTLLTSCSSLTPNVPTTHENTNTSTPSVNDTAATHSSTPSSTPIPTMEPPKNADGNYYLVGVAPPYEVDDLKTYLQIDGQSFMMAGKMYSNGVTLNYDKAYGLFNLDGKYQTLSFILGHVDKTNMKSSVISFFVDGQEIKSIEVLPEDMPYNVTIPLNGGSQLKILQTCSGRVGLGLAEIVGK